MACGSETLLNRERFLLKPVFDVATGATVFETLRFKAAANGLRSKILTAERYEKIF